MELSTDAGATWSALPPNGPPLDAVPANGLIVSRTATGLLLFDPSQGRVPGSRQGWVTAGGRLVLVIEITDPAGGDARTLGFVAGGPDGGFTMAAPPGLPADLINVDGSVASTDHAMYVSDDGWTWREAWHDDTSIARPAADRVRC